MHVIALTGGEAHSVTSHPNGVSAFEWSPDGKRIVFTTTVRADERVEEDAKHKVPTHEDELKDAWDKQREKEQHEHEDTLRFDPRTVHEFPYRTGTSFVNDSWSHVYVADVPESFADDPKPKALRLTDGETNFSHPSWTRDGQSLIANMSRRPKNDNELIEFWEDLVRIGVNPDARELQTLIATNYSHFHAQVSPDGKWVAFERYLEDQPEFRNTTLAVMPVQGGDVIELTAHLDRSVNEFAWGKDSAWLYFTLTQNGSVNLYRVSLANRQVEALTDTPDEITCFDVDAQGRVIFAASSMADPSALYLREVDGRITMLYQPNAKFLAERDVRPVEEIRYPSDEFQIPGLDYDAARL